MTQTVFAFETLQDTRQDCSADAGQKSHERVFDPYRFRAQFPDHWSGFLRAHFKNAEHVAVSFDVTYQTARNWWEGTHRPSGDKVALAAVSMPRRFQQAFGRVA